MQNESAILSFLRMIAEEEKVILRWSKGSPKTAGILSMPASQAAVRHRPLHWLGVDPGPPHSEKKGVMKLRTRDVTITVRCTEDERRKIRERAASRGLKLSDFVLRSALGKKIVVLDGFHELSKQLKAVGNNLNQLTRLCNEGRVKVAELKEQESWRQKLSSKLCRTLIVSELIQLSVWVMLWLLLR